MKRAMSKLLTQGNNSVFNHHSCANFIKNVYQDEANSNEHLQQKYSLRHYFSLNN